MFDLRHHVASLAAAFPALIIGILVGVGISTGGFVQKSERRILDNRIDELESRLDAVQQERWPGRSAACGRHVPGGVVPAAHGRSCSGTRERTHWVPC